jgi:multidrug efflux system membrane fusion protein
MTGEDTGERGGIRAAALLGLLAFAAGACSNSGAAGTTSATPAGGRGGAGAPVTVEIATVMHKPMAVSVRVVGNVEPSSTVAVRSQVSGELLAVHFTEGQAVARGDLLFTIDPRPFETALKQAEAALARDRAQSKNAEAQLTRSSDLLGRGLVSQSQHDVLVAQAEALRASIEANTAQVDNARLQLQHTRISAPLGGRTGALLVHPGALVRATDASPLVVINQVSPVFVSFAVPAKLLPLLREDARRGQLRAEAAPAGSTESPATGAVTFFDNAVDPATDTIRLKASFPNGDGRLWPGAFVDVRLQRSVLADAVVIPNAAIQNSQNGQMVFVVKADDTVEVRPIAVAWTEGDESVVESGLTSGETVVTDGQLRLTAGARVVRQAAEAARED